MVTVIPIEDLRRSPTAALFEGGDTVPASIFVTRYERGQGPDPHVVTHRAMGGNRSKPRPRPAELMAATRERADAIVTGH